MNDFPMKQLKQIVSKAMSNASVAHDAIFENERNETAIIGYLNRAGSLICEAEAIYFSNRDDEYIEIENFFKQFDAFISESLTNIITKHSHQWSDIEFIELKEMYKQCILSQPEPT